MIWGGSPALIGGLFDGAVSFFIQNHYHCIFSRQVIFSETDINIKMVLSIIICTFNRVNFLEICINSIIEQIHDHNNIEILIIGDNINKDYLDEIAPKIELKIKRKVSFFLSNKSLKQKSLTIFEA